MFGGVLYGDFSFVEPETFSDQRRQLLIINTDPDNGYYVDVFRSRRRDGKDRMHDYFYHNIGQSFELDVPLEPTEELSFAGAHLSAYSWLWDKYAAETSGDVNGRFTMTLPDSSEVGMNIWMKGEKDRKVFKVLSPKIVSLTRTPMPYDVDASPCQTFVARQYGEAWTRPFVVVYEPYASSDSGSSAIETVEFPDYASASGRIGSFGEVSGAGHGCGAEWIRVVRRDGRTDLIMSSDGITLSECGNVCCNAVLAVVSSSQMFMARGTSLSDGNVSVTTDTPATVAVKVREDGSLECWSDSACRVKVGKERYRLAAGHHIVSAKNGSK